MNEKYSFESAESEADELRNKVETNKVDSYAEAEEQLESENFISSPERMIPGFNMEGLQSPKRGLYVAPGKSETYDFNTAFTDFAISALEHTSKARWDALRSGIQDKVLIDIGAGDNTNGYIIAQMLGAKGYIALEPHNYKHLYAGLSSSKEEAFQWPQQSPKRRTMPFCVVAEGVETFLQRVPDNSVAIMASAIDESVLSKFAYKQIQEISTEIERVIAPGGAYLNFMSYLKPPTLKGKQEGLFHVYTKEL